MPAQISYAGCDNSGNAYMAPRNTEQNTLSWGKNCPNLNSQYPLSYYYDSFYHSYDIKLRKSCFNTFAK